MPPRSRRPCTVPRCRGTLETGTRDGRLVEWCPVCERRILFLEHRERQVAALEARLAAPPASGPLSDAALLDLVPQRLTNAHHVGRLVRRSPNAVSHAIQQGEIAHVRIGRIVLVSVEAARRWSAARPSRGDNTQLSRAIVPALPRTPADALTVQEIAERTGLRPASVSSWSARALAQGRRLQRVPGFGASGRPVTRFWWQEPEGAARA